MALLGFLRYVILDLTWGLARTLTHPGHGLSLPRPILHPELNGAFLRPRDGRGEPSTRQGQQVEGPGYVCRYQGISSAAGLCEEGIWWTAVISKRF